MYSQVALALRDQAPGSPLAGYDVKAIIGTGILPSPPTRMWSKWASRTCIMPGPEYFPIEHFRNHMTGQPSVFSGKIA